MAAIPQAVIGELSPVSSIPSLYKQEGILNGLRMITCCTLVTVLFISGSILSPLFVRTPYENLSIEYFIDHAKYNVDIENFEFNSLSYSNCSNNAINEDCDVLAVEM